MTDFKAALEAAKTIERYVGPLAPHATRKDEDQALLVAHALIEREKQIQEAVAAIEHEAAGYEPHKNTGIPAADTRSFYMQAGLREAARILREKLGEPRPKACTCSDRPTSWHVVGCGVRP